MSSLRAFRALFRRAQRPAEGASGFRVGTATINVAAPNPTARRQEARTAELLRDGAITVIARATRATRESEEILNKIWGMDANPTNRTIDNFIVKLRKKIEKKPEEPKHILTVYGFGYKLVVEEEGE